MFVSSFRIVPSILVFALAGLASQGCATRPGRTLNPASTSEGGAAPAPVRPPRSTPPRHSRTEAAPVVVDEASVIIAEATDLYLLGEEAYRAGNMERARRHFDAAVLRFLNSGQVIAENPRLQVAFDRILGDIRSLESEALADQEENPDRSDLPMEGIRDITEFLSPDELAAEKEKVGEPEDIDDVEEFSIPVALNDQVLTFIEAFENTPRFRKAFQGGYRRMGRYEPMIRRILREEGLPEDLIYLAFIESTFKTNAYSRARAKGMWQFMASTGSRYGLVRNYYVDDRSDPEKATRAAAKYLKDLHEMFGDWYLAMAGYNAGEMKVIRAIRRTGKRDFWALARTRHLMRETKNFVPSILALSIMSRDPARYGHEGLKKDPPLLYDWVTVDGPTEIALVAKLTGASTRSIQELNPQLRRSVTPPGVRTYKVRVPRGKGEAFQRAYAAMPDSEKIASVMVRYRVRRGDTLGRIARRHGTTVAALAQANGIRSRSRIYAGSTLLVPRGSGGSASEWHRSSGWAGELAGPDGIYTVRRGDTLSAIAIRHGTTVSRLTSLNGISARSILRPGQALKVRPPSEASAASGPAHAYKVRRGDTLSTIARRHGTTIARIEAMNGISRHSILYPGQQLKIPRTAARGTSSGAARGSRHVRYTVRRGDSLYAIAMSHGTTVERLRSWNKMGRRSRIYPGEVLDIFVN